MIAWFSWLCFRAHFSVHDFGQKWQKRLSLIVDCILEIFILYVFGVNVAFMIIVSDDITMEDILDSDFLAIYSVM